MFRGGASYADAITFGADKMEKKLVEEFTKVRGKKTLLFLRRIKAHFILSKQAKCQDIMM